MPKVKQFSAAWLSGNAPGRQLFEPSTESLRYRALSPSFASKKQQPTCGPRRTIARRGTEVFVAVGKEIRWGDLVYLRDDWATKQPRARGDLIKQEEDFLDGEAGLDCAVGFRTLKTPVADDIRQLVMSPDSSLLAILTTHTVHICILPDSSHLTAHDTGPMRPRIFTLGPTTHVTSRSSIASAVWHPLGVKGSCIVTVTTDAIVRLWEMSPTDRWSYDTPSMSIDLKKLIDGTCLDQDFTAPSAATNKSFSPDSFEMEVAATTFAARGSGGWSPMTLWIAMREGDVYALCPLLPDRWSPPPTLIPSLSVSVVTTVATIEDDPSVDDREKLLAQQQLQWMAELDAQEPQVLDGGPGERSVEVYTRPVRPGAIPRLQGPFNLVADPESSDDLDTTITDVLVIGKKTETDRLMMGEDEDLDFGESDEQGLSLTIVCLVSTSGQVRVYLDIEGVQAQWLPPKRLKPLARLAPGPSKPSSLLAFQAIDTMSPVEVSDEGWPVFSTDVMSRYSFFVTHHAAITFISLTSWVFRLEGELVGDHEAGADFRIGLLVKAQSGRDRLYAQPTAEVSVPLSGCVAIRDPDLGYFVLSSTPYDAVALTLETPEMDPAPASRLGTASLSPEAARPPASIMAPLDFYEPRPAFNAPYAFGQDSALPTLLERLKSSRHKTVVGQEVKLSPLTLQIMTEAHKVLSDETFKLGVAAAELFRQCHLLQTELREQICKASEVKGKVDAISGAGRSDFVSDKVAYERRLAAAQERRDGLAGRVDGLRKLVNRATARELSIKERGWVNEVRTLAGSVLGEADTEQQRQQQPARQPWRRLEEATGLRAELAGDAAELAKEVAEGDDSRRTSGGHLRIPKEVRRRKMQQVQGLLARESALVEALTARLERLQTEV
ncbi:hypothetical protein XA68_10296 [Ophiocordyceps unilateralis]|uniref:Nucleoporin Nup82 n=1 Tax=Ophiocordyceps unilateralis TaxID=268505 RepID=A0A2A9P2N1_OPHUN|nr:hypothetical protein XA68_10296 [Ophiocordyceps unilateralis]